MNVILMLKVLSVLPQGRMENISILKNGTIGNGFLVNPLRFMFDQVIKLLQYYLNSIV